MKHLSAILLCIFLSFSNATASDSELGIGVPSDYVPFSYLEGAGYTGFDVELVQALAEEVGVPYYLHPMQREKLLAEMDKGKIQMVIGAFTKPEYGANKHSYSVPYLNAGQALLVRANDSTNDIDSLDGKTIGTKLASDGAFYLYDHHPEASVSMFPYIKDAYEELIRQEVDAVFFDSPALEYFAATKGKDKVKTTGTIYAPRQLVMVFPKDSKWQPVFNQALSISRQLGTYDKLHSKWFGSQKGVEKTSGSSKPPIVKKKNNSKD